MPSATSKISPTEKKRAPASENASSPGHLRRNESDRQKLSNNSSPSNAALKTELEGLLRGAKYMTKEQLILELEGVLKKY